MFFAGLKFVAVLLRRGNSKVHGSTFPNTLKVGARSQAKSTSLAVLNLLFQTRSLSLKTRKALLTRAIRLRLFGLAISTNKERLCKSKRAFVLFLKTQTALTQFRASFGRAMGRGFMGRRRRLVGRHRFFVNVYRHSKRRHSVKR